MDCSYRSVIRAELDSEIFSNHHVDLMRREIRQELFSDIEYFRNIRSLTLNEWESFNLATGQMEIIDDNNYDDDADNDPTPSKKKRKIHAPRSYHYNIGDYKTSTYYKKFLSDRIVPVPHATSSTVREQTRRLSLNPKSTFRAWFRMPLYKVELLSQRFLDEKWITLSHHCRTEAKLKIKIDLLVLAALAMLGGTVHSFRQLPTLTNICATEHNKFFLLFIRKLYSIRNEFIYMPRNEEELRKIMKRYEEVGLPGAMGSIDVVHVKWSRCPAGDFNRAKGKETYPSLAFECISDFDRRICNVFGPQFGSRNDKHIVKMDDGVSAVKHTWYNSVPWSYFDSDGNIQEDRGAYLICDNGYIQWPITICPYMRSETNTPLESCFSANLESVRKDVECVFGILKERWSSLQLGFKYRRIDICQHIFVACCVLHNMMLDEMTKDDSNSKIGRGICLPNDGMWLDGPTATQHTKMQRNKKEKEERMKFHDRRLILARHLRVWRTVSSKK